MTQDVERKLKDTPLIFNAEMIRAFGDDRKTQTRRIMDPQPKFMPPYDECWYPDSESKKRKHYATYLHFERGIVEDFPRYGGPGDRIWGKEGWRVGAWGEDDGRIAVDYRADNFARQEWLQCEDDDMFLRLWEQSSEDAEKSNAETDEEGAYHWEPGQSPCRWRPSRFMPKFASRITREIVSVRVERLQEISEADAIAEGVKAQIEGTEYPPSARGEFHLLWDSINAKRGYGWDTNPWVWVLELKKIDAT